MRSGHRNADPRRTRGVDLLERQHGRQVGIGIVVAEHRANLPGGGLQIPAGGTEVVGRRCCRVIDVGRVDHTVAIAVDAPVGPRRRNELHRADGAVVDLVAVQPPAVGITDQRRADSVQRYADDSRRGRAVGVQLRIGEPAMVRLDAPDRGKQRPGQPARGVARHGLGRSSAVSLERDGRDAVGGQAGHRRTSWQRCGARRWIYAGRRRTERCNPRHTGGRCAGADRDWTRGPSGRRCPARRGGGTERARRRRGRRCADPVRRDTGSGKADDARRDNGRGNGSPLHTPRKARHVQPHSGVRRPVPRRSIWWCHAPCSSYAYWSPRR